MVLLQWYSSRAYRHICRNLHSNMVLLQWSGTATNGKTQIFTFQYGSTSIRTSSMFLAALSNLHSNMVLLQLILLPRTHVLSCYLHSNMVLLQLYFFHILHDNYIIYIPIWFYFNPTVLGDFDTFIDLHSNMVLLQSSPSWIVIILLLIYIPIWFYFNQGAITQSAVLSRFTFQYGSTSILPQQ